jgi:hypothetical protein
MAAKITMTEALAGHKLTLKKIEDKIASISHYVIRPEEIVDPMLKSDTTSEAFIAKEMQAMDDLSRYAVALRSAIADKNGYAEVEVMGIKMTVEQALVWRREIAPLLKKLYDMLLQSARNARTARDRTSNQPVKCVVNFDEQDIMKRSEALTDALGKLDTQLSIINATQVVEV